ncbi:hypothetical protein [Sphingomonas sp.]|uniref:hypothetical protein n=1 Tax=Sphingomonas sp. TaxID=28214 RepID=UPI00286D7753|nr:hypothetical protein [Sphingomonas sp.]
MHLNKKARRKAGGQSMIWEERLDQSRHRAAVVAGRHQVTVEAAAAICGQCISGW